MAENKYKKSETAARVSGLDRSNQMAHRDRKNPRSAELWLEAKRKRNAERPHQIWVHPLLGTKGEVIFAGYWAGRD